MELRRAQPASTLNIIGVGIALSTGMRKGAIIDVEETINSISSSLEDGKEWLGTRQSCFLGIGGNHIESINSKVLLLFPMPEMKFRKMMWIVFWRRRKPFLSRTAVFCIIPKSFTVDEQKGIKYPVGMTGIRLKWTRIITGLVPAVKNIEKCVLQAGVDIDDIIPSCLASAEAVLSKRQKELGVVVVDVGCGGTSICVFEEGTTLHTAVIPVGGENVTNDIAIGLRTSIDTAEKIKIEYGTCLPGDVSEREVIDLSLMSKIDTQKVSKKMMAEIIEARYHEIFILVKDELAKIHRDGMLPAGVVLTGASVKIPGTIDLARETLNLPVQIGFPQNFDGVVDKIDDPAYATAIGLILWGSRLENRSYGFSLKGLNLRKAVDGMRDWVKNLFP